MKSNEAKADRQDTPEDGVPDSDEEPEDRKEQTPERRDSKLKPDEDLSQAIRRAIHLADRDLLEDILDKDPAMANHYIDKSKNMQVIHLASQSDQPVLVKLLIDHGADPDSQDNKKWTPLIIAAMNGNYEVVKTLTKEGANKGIEDIEGKTLRDHVLESLE